MNIKNLNQEQVNKTLDHLDMLTGKIDIYRQVTKQGAINYWSSDEITEEDTNCFIDQIKLHGFHNSVPLDAQVAMRSWAECEPSEENGKYLKAFAEIARLALGIE